MAETKGIPEKGRFFTGRYDRDGKPIHFGNMLVKGMSFTSVEWISMRNESDTGEFIGFFIPDGAKVIGWTEPESKEETQN